MKVKDGFYLTAIGTDFVIIASTPETKKEFDGMLRLNETGAFLWKKLADGATEAELADALAAEYGVSREVSEKDTADFLDVVVTYERVIPEISALCMKIGGIFKIYAVSSLAVADCGVKIPKGTGKELAVNILVEVVAGETRIPVACPFLNKILLSP